MYILYFYIFLCTDSLKSSYCFTGAPYLLELWKLGNHTGRVSSLFKKKQRNQQKKKNNQQQQKKRGWAGGIQQLLSLGRELKDILMKHLQESKNLKHPQCALLSFWSCNAFLSPWLVSDLLKQNKSPRKKMHLNVLLFYFYFCSLFVHAVIHSSTCLAPKTKRPLSLKPRKNMCKLFLKAVSMSLPSSCLPWHFSVSAVFEVWGEKTLHLVQCRVRSQSWRRSLDRCSGCIFIDFERICASRVFSCCLWGSAQRVFCLPFVGMGLFCAWAPLEIRYYSKDQTPPKCPQTSATAISHNSVCFPALGQHSQRCWWRAWKCPVSSGTLWRISLTSHVRQTTA